MKRSAIPLRIRRATMLVLALWCTAVCDAAPYQIGHATITFRDAARNNRIVETEVYYPANAAGDTVPVAAGAFPVIAFGHGFVMTVTAYQNIWTALVPRGYIVALPKTEGSISPNHLEFGRDLAFVVRMMRAEGGLNNSRFKGHVAAKAAVMGHSMGGGASVLAASLDSTINAVANLAAAETNPSAKTTARLVRSPALIIVGANDCVAPPASHGSPIYDSLGAACRAYISVNGASHCQFAEQNSLCNLGEASCTPPPTISRASQHGIVNDFLVPWLDYVLKGDCRAWDLFDARLDSSTAVTSRSSCVVAPARFSLGAPRRELCVGDTLLLSAPPGYTAYRWSNGAFVRSIAVADSGAYSVVATDANGCTAQSDTVRAVILPRPERPFVAGPSRICSGTTATLAVPGGYRRYAWSTGDTTSTITAGREGLYSVRVFNSEGCSVVSDTVHLKVSERPRARIIALRSTVFCEGDSAVLQVARSAGEPEHTRYLWSTGDTTQSITVRQSGRYSVVVTDTTGCVSDPAEMSTVNNPNPRPEVVRSGDSLIASVAGLTYRWWRDGAALADTGRGIHASVPGEYVVAVMSLQGCTGSSAPYRVVSSGVERDAARGGLRLVPVPATGMIRVELAVAPAHGSADLAVFDAAGRMVIERAVSLDAGAVLMLDVRDLPAGVYYLRVRIGAAEYHERFVKR